MNIIRKVWRGLKFDECLQKRPQISKKRTAGIGGAAFQ
jgi:hypothetical protein